MKLLSLVMCTGAYITLLAGHFMPQYTCLTYGGGVILAIGIALQFMIF